MMMLTNLFGEERGECLELADIALVEREQQLLDPLMRGTIKRVQDRMHELWSDALATSTRDRIRHV